MTEKEKQRNGRNKATLVDHSYINSGNYKKKFDHISSDKKLSRLLYKLAKDMLVHRSGTSLEDMYWVDIDTLEIVAQEINMMVEKKIVYSGTTLKNIRKHEHLLTVHTHPNSFPPSIEDFNSNFDHEYEVGIVICHNGKVYIYSANERVNENYYKMVVEGYIRDGYNENEAQMKALCEIEEHFDIRCREVEAHDVV